MSCLVPQGKAYTVLAKDLVHSFTNGFQKTIFDKASHKMIAYFTVVMVLAAIKSYLLFVHVQATATSVLFSGLAS